MAQKTSETQLLWDGRQAASTDRSTATERPGVASGADDVDIRARAVSKVQSVVAELLGDEAEFVEYIFEGIQNHKHPRDLVADVQDVLDDDTDAFVVDLYGKVIFEIEKREYAV